MRHKRVPAVSARRVGGLAGVLFLPLLVAAPEPRLKLETPAAEQVRQFYVDSTASFRAWLFLVGLGYAAFLVFLAVLRSELAAPESGVLGALVLVSGALTAGFSVLATAVNAVPALDLIRADTDPVQAQSWARFAGEAYDTIVEAGTFWRGVLLAAVAVAVLQYGRMPRWLGWLAAILAFGALVGPAIGWFEWQLEPVGFVLGYGSFILFHVWVLLTSAVLILRPSALVATATATR